jgi:hypothetical protein
MFLNVWLVIWPNQKMVIGMKDGDKAAAAAKAGLASRTNTLFSGPMLLGMLGSKHLYISRCSGYRPDRGLRADRGTGAECDVRPHGPHGERVGVVHLSIALTGVIWALLAFL